MFRVFAILAVAVMAAMAFMPSAAEATAYSSTELQVTSGSFSGAGFTGFSSFFFRLNDISAELNGTTIHSGGVVFSTTSGSSLDQPVTFINTATPAGCVSVISCGGFANNVFFPSVGVTPGLGNYAVADTHELNTLLSASTGNWGTRSQTQLTGATEASAQTGADNTLAWNFTSPGGAVTFGGLLTENFSLFLDATGVIAHGSADMTVQIISENTGSVGQVVATLFDLSSGAFSACVNSSLTVPGTVHPCNDLAATISGTTTLTAGQFELLIQFGTSSDVIQRAVPEPATLSLLGLGLVGSAFLARRRRG